MFHHKLLSAPRSVKRTVMVSADLLLLPCSVVLSVLMTSSGGYHVLLQVKLLAVVLTTTILTIAMFARLGLYRAVVRFMGRQALLAVIQGSVLSALVFIGCLLAFSVNTPVSVSVVYLVVLFFLVGGSRFLVREYLFAQSRVRKKKVIIYGAGSSGLQLLTSLNNSSEYEPVALIDDLSDRVGAIYRGIRVYPSSKLSLLIDKWAVEQVLLAMPSAPMWRRKEILADLEPMPVRVMTVPTFEQLVSGDASIEETRDVAVEDLLGRDPVKPIPSLLEGCITGKVVLVTGSGGSIGSELCRQILKARPSKLLLFERCEFALYQIDRELQEIASMDGGARVIPLLGCVQKLDRLQAVMGAFHVDTVYHAAAYKHVPMVEQNVIEGVQNNVLGTYNAAKAAKDNRVSTFVLVSTDKAVRPTNVMGASKRLAELVLQGLAQEACLTTFCMVRFGNVLGSSGSVVPLFRKQIKSGGPVTVTHPEIIRYFMTIPEAVQLVVQASSMAKGGDVFVLDMGEPVKIAELAKAMIRLMGLEVKDEHVPSGDIEVKYTGLRPGEKLFEELLIGENVSGTAHPRIMKADELSLSWSEMERILNKLSKACAEGDCEAIRELLLCTETGYAPNDGLNDTVWHQECEEPAANNVVPVEFRREQV
ncbi:nucleoside-diphosphate sugar epimerase [Gammaproteobacteria bacterium 45_16_T64]|nr:nucleoside-diphosphate sugar epimerase [Gammaproteobacteria bacterium 45_16_T64]